MPEDNDNDDRGSVASTELSPRRTRTRSLRSWRSRSRPRSRPEPHAHLHRIYSSGFIDDHGTYVNSRDSSGNRSEPECATSPVGEEEAPEDLEEVEKPEISHESEVIVHENDEGVDLEKARTAPSLYRQQTNKSGRSVRDPNVVSWKGVDDLENPKNWSKLCPEDLNTSSSYPARSASPQSPHCDMASKSNTAAQCAAAAPRGTHRKWAAVLVVSSFTFISPVSSSMVAPALPRMDADLGITEQVTSQMLLSIFILAYAIGPLVLGPLSEVYGRVIVLQLANLFFLVFNLACGFATTAPQMLVFRFLAGLGGSAPLAIGGGILADCFRAEERGKAIGVYSLAPLIGPAVGPIAGGFISENTTWRWVFYAVTIADAVIQIAGLFLLQETWAPKLLENKVKKLRKETGNNALYAEGSRKETVSQKLKISLMRPFVLLFTQPTVIVFAIYMAYLYGLVYLVISSFPGMYYLHSDSSKYERRRNRSTCDFLYAGARDYCRHSLLALYTSPVYYNESTEIGGLHYVALAIGYFVGAQSTGRFNDWLYARLKSQNNGVGLPEFRVPVMMVCAVLLPTGFFWYGWSAEARLHWIMPDIGAGIIAAATICGYYAIQTYIIDSYTKYAASAVAAISCLRSLAGFGFPLFAPAMYNALGYGWGNSLLAFVAIAIGVPAPIMFWKYGAALRAKSQYAAG
ncbi:hypothetical protein LTR29_004287 [Friedmanniomyces endolithicus]|nr:hypothetical protein LTR29_004287 [Friedmanniomyces endolithicus]